MSEYALFSRSGFTQSIKEVAEERGFVHVSGVVRPERFRSRLLRDAF